MARLAQRARLFVDGPDMAANRAANKPMADAKLLGKWEHTSLDIPTLRAGKGTYGDVGPHVDEKIWAHDGQPFFRMVKAARLGTPRTKDRAGSGQKRCATLLQVTAGNHHAARTDELQPFPLGVHDSLELSRRIRNPGEQAI
jgi:hypothetical protein